MGPLPPGSGERVGGTFQGLEAKARRSESLQCLSTHPLQHSSQVREEAFREEVIYLPL